MSNLKPMWKFVILVVITHTNGNPTEETTALASLQFETTEKVPIPNNISASLNTSISLSQPSFFSASVLRTLKVVGDVKMYGYSIIGALAITGNTLSLLVLMRQKQNLSPYTYLRALAACDLIVGVGISWQGTLTNARVLSSSGVARQLYCHTMIPTYTLTNAFTTAGAFLAMTLSLDRMIAVMFPLNKAIWCTVRRARMIVAAILLFAAAVDITLPFRMECAWVWNAVEQVALPRLIYTSFGNRTSVRNYILYLNLLVRMSIPLICMVIANTFTLRGVIQSRRFQQKMAQKAKAVQNVQCVAMTIGVVVMFVITNIPRAIYFWIAALNIKYTFTSLSVILVSTGELITWSNCCVNFFIYAFLNRSFRQDVKKIFCGKKASPMKGNQEKNSKMDTSGWSKDTDISSINDSFEVGKTSNGSLK